MFIKEIEAEIAAYEEYHAQQAEEAQRLAARLQDLEKASREAYETVAGGSNSSTAQQRLDDVDAKIQEIKKEMRLQRRRTQNRTRSMRARLLQSQEQALERLEEDLKGRCAEQNALRNDQIPEIERRLAALNERVAEIEEESSAIRREIQDISRLDVDALFQG